MASHRITIQCWKSETSLRNLLLLFSRYEECSTCNADLHACISCKNYAHNLANSCSEDRAEFVQDNEKANFCDFFKVNSKAYRKKGEAASIVAKASLAELLAEEVESGAEAETSPTAQANKVLAELRNLFDEE